MVYLHNGVISAEIRIFRRKDYVAKRFQGLELCGYGYAQNACNLVYCNLALAMALEQRLVQMVRWRKFGFLPDYLLEKVDKR